MSSNIQLFYYEKTPARVVMLDGQPWWVAKDVCDILELSNPTVAIDSLDDDERAKFYLGRQGEANIISESGLYSLIFRSNKPEAKAFSRWVRHEVLPQVMRNGLPEKSDEKLTKTIMYATKMILDAAGIKNNQLALALDRVATHYVGQSLLALSGTVLEAPNKCQLLTPTEIGKHFGVSARKVNAILCANGYQKREGKDYEPLEAGEPYAVMLDTNKRHSNGTPVRQLKWESSFLTEIEDLFKE